MDKEIYLTGLEIIVVFISVCLIVASVILGTWRQDYNENYDD